MKTINVVAAVIFKDGRVFATQRGYGEFKDGWEFPYASTFPHCSMKSSEYLWPKTKRLVKDERRSKSKLRVCA